MSELKFTRKERVRRARGIVLDMMQALQRRLDALDELGDADPLADEASLFRAADFLLEREQTRLCRAIVRISTEIAAIDFEDENGVASDQKRTEQIDLSAHVAAHLLAEEFPGLEFDADRVMPLWRALIEQRKGPLSKTSKAGGQLAEAYGVGDGAHALPRARRRGPREERRARAADRARHVRDPRPVEAVARRGRATSSRRWNRSANRRRSLMSDIDREKALAIVEGVKSRGENANDTVVLVMDEGVPQLADIARNLAASKFAGRSPGELALFPFAIAMPRAESLAFLEAMRLLEPLRGDEWGPGEMQRRTINATLDQAGPDALKWLRVTGWPTVRVMPMATDTAPPPPKPAPRPRWRVKDGPTIGPNALPSKGQVFGDADMPASERARIESLPALEPYKFERLLPYEIRGCSEWPILWLSDREVYQQREHPRQYAVPMWEETSPDVFRELSLEERDKSVERTRERAKEVVASFATRAAKRASSEAEPPPGPEAA